jgi:hypothetical protein
MAPCVRAQAIRVRLCGAAAASDQRARMRQGTGKTLLNSLEKGGAGVHANGWAELLRLIFTG